MTPRTVVSYDLKEIPALEIRCQCGSVVSMKLPKHNLNRDMLCPGCNATLWTGEDQTHMRVLGLLRSLSAWQQSDTRAFTLGFSLEGDARASRDKG